MSSTSAAVVQQVRHGLVTQRAVSLFGSSQNGSCTSFVLGESTYCNGTSVLNDGVIPVLSGVSNDTNSTWAEHLFTVIRLTSSRVLLSFELEDATHDRIELSVFNCPELWINTPKAEVYIDASYRPERPGPNPGDGILDTTPRLTLSNTSCDYLIKFCIRYSADAVPTRFINLALPYSGITNTSRVFIGEVTFVNGGGSPCGPPELITTTPGKSTMFKMCAELIKFCLVE